MNDSVHSHNSSTRQRLLLSLLGGTGRLSNSPKVTACQSQPKCLKSPGQEYKRASSPSTSTPHRHPSPPLRSSIPGLQGAGEGPACRPVDAPTREFLLGPHSWHIATLLSLLELPGKGRGKEAAQALAAGWLGAVCTGIPGPGLGCGPQRGWSSRWAQPREPVDLRQPSPPRAEGSQRGVI